MIFDDYEKIIIGIGEAFNIKVPKDISEIEKLRYVKDNTDNSIVEAYNILAKNLQGKEFFIVSTCTDDVILNTDLDSERVVLPCGGFRYFQCPDDCMNELLPFYNQVLENDKLPVCPHCNKEVVFNRLPLEKYNEGGYLEQWEKYNRFLQGTVNKSLLILELGVGMNYPSVIRFPFEKIAMFNKKSKMIRVHPTLAFSTPEIKDTCECISADPVAFLRDLC